MLPSIFKSKSSHEVHHIMYRCILACHLRAFRKLSKASLTANMLPSSYWLRNQATHNDYFPNACYLNDVPMQGIRN